jgi:hypothetical protein
MAARQMVIPPKPPAEPLRSQTLASATAGRRSTGPCASRRSNVRDVIADPAQLVLEHKMYVSELRSLLVERLKLEDEYERLQMYSRDTRFDLVDIPTKWDLSKSCHFGHDALPHAHERKGTFPAVLCSYELFCG